MSFIHAKKLDDLFRAWAQTVSIQSQTQVVSTFGDVSSTWANRTNLGTIKARIARANNQQQESAQLSGYTVTHQALIPGYYTQIVLNDRLLTTSVAYDIRSIEHDSEQSMTRLGLFRVVGPTT